MPNSRVYLVSLESPIEPEPLKRLLAVVPGLQSWNLALPTTVIVISDQDARSIAEGIRSGLAGGPFLVSEVRPPNYSGILAPAAWDFLNHPEALVAQPDVSKLIAARLGQSGESVDLSAVPAFGLAAMPLEPVSVPGLFSARDNEIATLLRNPPSLRPHGFDLRTGQQPINVAGQLLRAHLSGWKSLEIWRDGFLSFIADGQDDFLCWAQRERNPDRPLRINPLVLAEATLTFATLSVRLREHMTPRPTRVRYVLQLAEMQQNNSTCLLAPGPLDSYDWHGDEAHAAPSEGTEFSVTWSGGDPDPEEVAFSLVSSVYEWFGFTHEEIPYAVLESDGRGRISTQQIASAGRSSG